MKINFLQTKDERLLAFYENIRRQVDLDVRAGGRSACRSGRETIRRQTTRRNRPAAVAIHSDRLASIITGDVT